MNEIVRLTKNELELVRMAVAMTATQVINRTVHVELIELGDKLTGVQGLQTVKLGTELAREGI